MFLSSSVAVLRTEGHIGSGLCPLTMLRHLANLQAPNTLRQGIPLLLRERSPGFSVSAFYLLFAIRVHYETRTTLASAPGIYNSRDAPRLCAGWPASMIRPLITRLQFILALVFVPAAYPHPLRPQSTRTATPPPQNKPPPNKTTHIPTPLLHP